MESVVHLLITRRGPVWRVRILLPGEPRPRWRAYRAVDYPTPEAVARRCAEGLVAHQNPDDDTHSYSYEGCSNNECFRPAHGLPLRVRWEFWGRL
ncbi:hypothetical protein [uncultured Bilophila sp.]|uniref:hypothetical protein n=1 Tax=uncultured Bilophila sp. TaxID=529385 RepID=UPI00266F6AEE|nr:hypothetical protein [uncultured Bilophila sp.]